MMNDADLYILVEQSIENGLKEALNENLSISKEVEEETEKLANFIKTHFNLIIKQPYLYDLKIKSDEFNYCIFSTINFTIKCEIIYFSSQEEIDNYYKLCNFSEKTSLLNFYLYFRCAFLETINDFDEKTFKNAISHELMHIYEFIKKKFYLLNEKDNVLCYKNYIILYKYI